MRLHVLLAIISLTSLNSPAADQPQPDEGTAFFRDQVLPILQNRCLECHSYTKKVKGGLSLDTRDGWALGGDHGPALKPGNLKASPLIRAIRHHDADSAMPPETKLPPIEIAMLETWVLMGAPDPRGDKSVNPRLAK